MEIREALQAAVDQAETQSPEATTVAAPVVDQPVTESPATPAVTEKTNSERTRDQLGRFAQQETKPPDQQKPATEIKPIVEAKAPPKSWKKDFHEHWTKLDPAVQDYVAQREDEYFRGVGSYKQNAEVGQQFMEAARPYEAVMRSLNVTPVQAFQALANADYTLRTADPATKAQLFAQLAQQYGVSLENIQNPPAVDANTASLHQTIQQLRQEMSQLKGNWDGYQQTTVQSEIEKHASKPHFEELRPSMAQLLNSGIASDLSDAYDKALRLNPELFEQAQATQRQEAEQKRLQEAAQAAAKAKASAVQVTGSPSTALAEPQRGIRGAIEAAIDSSIR